MLHYHNFIKVYLNDVCTSSSAPNIMKSVHVDFAVVKNFHLYLQLSTIFALL